MGESATMKNIQNRNILIAANNEKLLRTLDQVLTAEGARVTVTKCAKAAIEILAGRSAQMDLIIVDLQMPLLTGITLVSSIPRIFPNLPVMAVATAGGPKLRTECFQLGAAAFLERPLNVSRLLATVEILANKNEEPPGSAGRRLPRRPACRPTAQSGHRHRLKWQPLECHTCRNSKTQARFWL
jgi:CheY-like chemotaxis protein